MSYKAVVAKIHISPLEGMDNLVLGEVSGYHVLVSKNVANGQLGVFLGSIDENITIDSIS